jgi:heme/copper-type cytochrome/quinol oxidase subunit 4
MMRNSILPPDSLIWLTLLGVTLLSWAIAESTLAPQLAATTVMLIAAFKIRLVFIHFMELGPSVQPWRTLFTIWVSLVTSIILLGYWFGRLYS